MLSETIIFSGRRHSWRLVILSIHSKSVCHEREENVLKKKKKVEQLKAP